MLARGYGLTATERVSRPIYTSTLLRPYVIMESARPPDWVRLPAPDRLHSLTLAHIVNSLQINTNGHLREDRLTTTPLKPLQQECLRAHGRTARNCPYDAFLHLRGMCLMHSNPNTFLEVSAPSLTQSSSRNNDSSVTVPPNSVEISAVYISRTATKPNKCVEMKVRKLINTWALMGYTSL